MTAVPFAVSRPSAPASDGHASDAAVTLTEGPVPTLTIKREGLVPINPEGLRKHYASLSDDALLLLERADLTPAAQKIFDLEVRRRRLDIESAEEETDSPSFSFFRSSVDKDDEDDSSLENAFTVTTFSGTASGPADAADDRS